MQSYDLKFLISIIYRGFKQLTGKGSFQLAPTIDGRTIATFSFAPSCCTTYSANAFVYMYVLGLSPINLGVISFTRPSSIHLVNEETACKTVSDVLL